MVGDPADRHKREKFVLRLRRTTPRRLLSALLASGSAIASWGFIKPAAAELNTYCQSPQESIVTKENLLQASLKNNLDAQKEYESLIKKDAEQLRQCRSQNWPQTQAIWLRLYECDATPGALERLLDRIVHKGYNQVNVEVFFNGQVLLPASDNPTPWTSVVRSPGRENADLLAQIIEKGRERGLKVYAWMFTLNFGYAYAQRPDRQATLALNGDGNNSLSVVSDQAFVDPYSRQAQIDYYDMLKAVLERRPDGVLFDYVRYPRGNGRQSVASDVKDLWIYGAASRQALYERGQNNKGRDLIKRYLRQGRITLRDVEEVDRLYPQEGAPLWEGRSPAPGESNASLQARYRRFSSDLWYLSVAHAAQGVIDFLALATHPVQQQGIPAGAVFFPGGNQVVGQQGFDSRLQPWNSFPASLEWHPMSYGTCGHPGCIVDQVQRVVGMAAEQTQITPALAGIWGESYRNRPPLEEQMRAIYRAVPEVKTVSHFAYSWQEPQSDSARRSCRS
ncbi:MAG: hypothetical protein ACFB4I_14240 [Cyanophyceae cyanobacterium]